MSNWIPTNELRFVRREVKTWTGFYNGEPTYTTGSENILQQKWKGEGVSAYTGEWEDMEEWRDVPVVEEEL